MIYREFHQIQSNPENRGYLPESALRALSQRTGTPLFRLQELASYYPHFRLQPPAQVEVRVCRDMSCHLRGGNALLGKLQAWAEKTAPGDVTIDGVSCLGRCDRGPVACVNHHYYAQESTANLPQIIRDALAGRDSVDGRDVSVTNSADWKIDPYQGRPEYRAVRQFIENPDPKRILDQLEAADLLGMGGAGAPAFRKWGDVHHATALDGQKFVVCNGDESEPGTFKDREILLQTPYLVVEGVMLAALTVGATRGYIFIRHEYPAQIAAVRQAIAAAASQGIVGSRVLGTERTFNLEVVESPGGYILGEQGALIESLEEKRGQPRNRPPQLETNGLHNKPTLLSNVETFAWSVPIALQGGEWYRNLGVNGFKGRRFFSISGDVKRPGVHEVPIGLPLGDLLELAGGTLDGGPPLAIAPSGPSGGFMPLHLPLPARVPQALSDKVPAGEARINVLDLPLDLGLFRQLGLMLGAGIVVYGQGRNMLEQALNCTRFFRNESCGKCVPCRIGSQKLMEIADDFVHSGQTANLAATGELVNQLAHAMEMTSICGLGVSAPNPLVSWFKHFQYTAAPSGVRPPAKSTGRAGASE